MAKQQEENLAIVRPGDYIEELEEKVMLEYNRIMASGQGVFPKREKKYRYTEHPDFGTDRKARIDWELSEIQKCKYGDGDIPGKYYYYLNHTYIRSKAKGKIRPEFRTTDLEWFKFLEEVEKNVGEGIVCIKRRQVGATTKVAAHMVYNCQFNLDWEIGMNSKSEADSQNFLGRVKYCYRNQSDFLRAKTSTDRRDVLEFVEYGKDAFGNKVMVGGTGSKIICVSPSPVAHAGNSYRELIIDEGGEIEELDELLANAEDCIIQDGVRTGTEIVFGTMGKTDKAGRHLKMLWKDYKIHNLRRFAFWGYNELILDEFGNDDILESLRTLIYRRKQLETSSPAIYNKFLQKYPLSEADAFLSTGSFGVGNPIIITQQKINLMTEAPERREGRMKMVGDKPEFEPNPGGHVIIYELPQKLKDGYTAVADPAEDDHVKKTKDSSDIGFSIVARPFGLMPPRLVARYCHRPAKLEEAYQQMAMMLMLYDTKIHIEMNKGGWRAYDWFSNNYPHLLALGVREANLLKSGVAPKHGVKMNTDRKLQMEGLLNQYIDNYCLPIPEVGYKGIPDEKLLDQFGVFGADGQDDDLAISFGWNLIIQQSDKRVALAKEQTQSTAPTYRLERVNGLLVPRFDGGSSVVRNVPKNLFDVRR